jgi:hypothetical protein
VQFLASNLENAELAKQWYCFRHVWARFGTDLPTAVALGESLAPLLIGLNRAFHLSWPWSDRLDLIRKAIPPILAGTAEIVLLWLPGPGVSMRFYIVAILVAIPLITFFAVKCLRSRFGETKNDQEVSHYARVRIGGGVYEFDINYVLVPIAAVVLVAAVALF